jgi:hypothetical protein
LTWGFVAPGRFFVSVFCHVCSWVWTQQSGACQIWPVRRRIQAHQPLATAPQVIASCNDFAVSLPDRRRH